MATANKITGFIVTASLSLSLGVSLSTQASPIQNGVSISNKIQKVTILGKRLSEEQKRLFDLEQRNKLTIQLLDKSPVVPANENLGKTDAILNNYKTNKSNPKTT